MGHGCSTAVNDGGAGKTKTAPPSSSDGQQVERSMQHSAGPSSQGNSMRQDSNSNEFSGNEHIPTFGTDAADQGGAQASHRDHRMTAFTISPAAEVSDVPPQQQQHGTTGRSKMQHVRSDDDDDEFDLPSLSSAVDVDQMPTNLRLRME